MKSKLLLFLLFSASMLTAQNKSFRVEFDYARFNYSDSSAYFEVYYSFYPGMFKSVVAEGKKFMVGELELLLIKDGTSDTALDRKYQFKTELNPKPEEQKTLVGNLGFRVPFGQYKCTLRGRDFNDTINSDGISFPVAFAPVPKDRFGFSDIILAASINKSENTSSIFYKNTYEVIPNPMCIYGSEMPVVYYYTELHNLDYKPSSELLKLECLLMNANRDVMYKRTKLIGRKNASIVEAAAVNVSKYPSGTYSLVLTLSDTVKNVKAVTSKKFFIYAPQNKDTISIAKSDNSFLSSEFAAMSDEDLDELFAQSKYLATKSEAAQWGKLSELDAKRNFLFTFWKNRDQVPETPENEYKNEYIKRTRYANEKFGTFRKKGWTTDRGRVMMMFGEPNEIERFPSEVDTKPYEIWSYNQIEGGVQFIFADLNGFGEYQLVHSTMRGEMRDEDWRRRVKAL